MDAVEQSLALKRISTWPREWKRDMTRLTANEVEVVGLFVALMDARPDGQARAED